MDSKSYSRTGKDRRQNDSFDSFFIPTGRRSQQRRTGKTGQGTSKYARSESPKDA